MAMEAPFCLVIEHYLAIHQTGRLAAHHRHLQRMPLAPDDGQVTSSSFKTVIIDELKQNSIVFQRIDSEDKIVADIPQAKDQSSCLIDAAVQWFDPEGEHAIAHLTAFADGQGEVVVGADGVEQLLIGPTERLGHQA